MIKQHGQLAEQFFSGNAATYDQIAIEWSPKETLDALAARV
jgi:hypothetical protein